METVQSETGMFNLLVSGIGWQPHRDMIDASRVLEHTDEVLVKRFMVDGKIDSVAVCSIPTIFMSELYGDGPQVARIGHLSSVRHVGKEYRLEYTYDEGLASLPNKQLLKMADVLHIDKFEFQRTHWAIKDIDLYRVLLRELPDAAFKPKVFRIDPYLPEEDLVSVMMPFDKVFDGAYTALSAAAEEVGLQCLRADDIWTHEAIIQDIASLISRSSVVICDLTGKNANVFYEVGIAHCQGKDVILITQSQDDVPFDLRHLRYVHYLNNGEGLRGLQEKVAARLQTILSHAR